jgi:20S proteasome alpha/beta subunit
MDVAKASGRRFKLLKSNNFGRLQMNEIKKKTKRVSIIVAISAMDALVVASDSRSTDEDNHTRNDVQKIFPITMRLHGQEHGEFGIGLVAHSGNIQASGRAVELLLDDLRCKEEFKDRRMIADAAQRAVTTVKNEIREQFKGTAEELQKHFTDHDFDLLIAYYFERKPCLYTVKFGIGLAQPRRERFVCTGCGGNLADFCLADLDVGHMQRTQAVATAIYAVEEVKRFDPFCAGETQIGIACSTYREHLKRHEPCAVIAEKPSVERLAKVINAASCQASRNWAQEMKMIITRAALEEDHETTDAIQ